MSRPHSPLADRWLAAGALVCCAASPRALAQSWTVDDDGPADFASIGAAIQAPQVQAGDVLLVFPGEYASFTLDKSLRIVAAAGDPWRAGFHAPSCTVRDVDSFALVGLRCRELAIERVSGRGLLDQCQLGEWEQIGDASPWLGGADIRDCAQLIAQRSSFHGTDACYPYTSELSRPALRVWSSTIAFAQCSFRGGDEAGWSCYSHYPTVAAAVELRDGSDATFAGCSLGAGTGSWGLTAPALRVEDSFARVRGSSRDGLHSYAPAFAIDGSNAQVSVSGLSIDPPQLPDWVRRLRPAAPVLALAGGDAPGASAFVALRAPLGAPALLAFALAPGFARLAPGVEPVWLDVHALLALLPLIGQGQEQPSALPLALPADPALAGLAVWVQAWLPPLVASDAAWTNPLALVLRW